eukprot:XP_001696721.1 predicted protein [Chlamydomonas reinhardtii]
MYPQTEQRCARGPGNRHRELLAYYPSYKIMPNGKRNHYQDGDRRAAMAPFLGYAMLTDPNLLAPHTRHPAALLSMGDGAGGGALCGRNFGHNVSACVNLWEGVVPFGGAGFIFSIGFFKQLTAYSNGGGFRAFEGCVHHPFNGSIMGWPEGGDAILSRCLWRMGFPVSVPPLDSPLGTKRFGETLTLQRLYAAAAALSNNSLPEDAAAQWTHGATVHLSVRDFKSYWDAAAAAKMFIAIYDMVAERLWPTKPRNGG